MGLNSFYAIIAAFIQEVISEIIILLPIIPDYAPTIYPQVFEGTCKK
jgi:hypothetical protein